MIFYKFLNRSRLLKKGSFFFFSVLFLFCCLSVKAQETNKLNLIIDADTANEVDDLYAIVSAILEPAFNLLAINSAQFHTSPLASENTVLESQKINEEIIQLMHVKGIALPLGSNTPLKEYDKPMSSEASQFIIETAHKMKHNEKLHVVILGACTNVASAILEDPSIISKIKVHYLGFWHTPNTNVYNKKEFNSGNDPIAVEVLLNTKTLDFNVMTATTSQHLVFTKQEVDSHLKNKKGIASYLVNRWETYARWWTKEDPEKEKWIMWDVAIIEALAHPELSTINYFLTPPENTQRSIGIHTKIDVNAMTTHFWNTLKNL
ncbi:nucleoside hydrolase [Lacinutrix sp. C3R15]|uniref:nucleoside hydrolase n=1 Tax=Flavobacteriaceae TaxID=49546 RepID=UPI001C0897B3|nr:MULTISPECIES: nucleoside hydrolase [Flavobacteriaceae]MBU2939532.1 nucleoside hydrolase [Lacinutrix sp. C3R15]MDO6622847.1 nucleoside hydrolase [Oceanihabitans sp. 1_MG-2023]